MAKIYYHNITKNKLNETEVVDVVFGLDKGDKLYKSEGGSAELFEVSDSEIKEIRQKASDYFNPDKN